MENKVIYLLPRGITKASGKSLLKTIQEDEGQDTLPSYDLIIRKGNMVGTGSKDLTFYTYDNYNRLIGSRVENTTSSYRYNAQGYRVLLHQVLQDTLLRSM